MSRQITTERSAILKQAYEKRARQRRARFLLGLIPLVGMLAGLYWLAHWDRLLLRVAQVEGASPSVAEKIQVLAAANLAGDYLGLWPRRNLFFYQRARLVQALAQGLPELEQIELSRSTNNLLIKVSERTPAYLWCDAADESCFFLDQSGFAYAPSPDFLGHPLFVIESAAPTPALASRPLGAGDFSQLVTLQASLASTLKTSIIGRAPERVLVGPNNELKFVSTNNLSLLANLGVDPLKLSANLKTALDAPAFATEYRASLAAGKHLDYLDLRFPDRIFYKFN